MLTYHNYVSSMNFSYTVVKSIFYCYFAKFSKFRSRHTHLRCFVCRGFVGMFLYCNLLNVYVNGLTSVIALAELVVA